MTHHKPSSLKTEPKEFLRCWEGLNFVLLLGHTDMIPHIILPVAEPHPAAFAHFPSYIVEADAGRQIGRAALLNSIGVVNFKSAKS